MQMAFFLVACTCKFDKVTLSSVCVDCRADVYIISGDRFRGRDQLRGGGRVDAVPGRAVPLEAGQYNTVQYSTVQYSATSTPTSAAPSWSVRAQKLLTAQLT